MGSRTPIDRSLGFTAMLELYPGFGQMTDAEGMGITTAFLEDWYRSDSTAMFEFAREWVTARRLQSGEVTPTELQAGIMDKIVREAEDHCGSDNPHRPHVITGTAVWCAGTTLDDYAAGEPGFCGSKIKHPPHDECPGLYEDQPCPTCGCTGGH